MIESFVKLKKRAKRSCILQSLLIGLCSATLAFASLFIAFKLVGAKFPWYGYASIVGGVFLLAAGVSLLCTYPTTKRFSRTLDERYSLGEKVQTMVEYSGGEGVLLELQREQTEKALSALPPRRKGKGVLFKVVLLPILAFSMLVTSIVVPSNYVEPIPESEKIYESDAYQLKDLEALIANVRASSLTEKLKPAYVATLEDLLDRLKKNESTVSEVHAAVHQSMTLIISITSQANTYNAYVRALKGNEMLAPLSQALSESGKIYKSISEINLYLYSTLANRENDIFSGVQEKLATYTSEIETEVSTMQAEEYTAYLTDYIAAIAELFISAELTSISETDGIKMALTDLQTAMSQSLARLNDAESGTTLQAEQIALATALTVFVVDRNHTSGAAMALSEQANSYLIKDYVLRTLADIFKVNIPREEEEEENKKDEEENKPNEGGGGGSGSLGYPDDGLVLDPADGTYKPYGELLSIYYKRVSELLEEDESTGEGKIPEELKQYLEVYFDALHSSED